MRRILVYDRAGIGKSEINPSDVFSAVLRERINGEHALEITTTQVLEKGTRLLHEDGRGIWREFAVSGIDADHAAGKTVVGDYYCPWSVQEDLMGVTVSVMPGVRTPTSASNALTSLLSSQSRWAKGTVTNTATGGASMYDRSAWEALKVLVDTWGGEVDVTIGVDNITGVVTRAIDLYTKQGEQTAKRRFDFGADANGIVRKLPDEPLFCRISPRGKGEETDAGGYGRKITIESVNDGKDYLEYTPMVDVAKMPNGSSGYIYPTKIVTNSNMETPTDLKAWAEAILAAECTPKVSYSVDVLQSDEAGTSAQGVSLGDAVQVVDAKFGDGLRIEARVVSMTTDLVAERVTNIELGSAENSISEKFASIGSTVAQMSNTLTTMSTAQYVDELVGRINTDINGTGGYTYIVPGEGIICYDVAVADPLIGSEASKVVQIKGGSMRIADTKLPSFSGINDWDWKTVFTSGHIAAEVVTAANIVTGYIGSSGSTFIDLDNNTVQLGSAGGRHVVLDSGGLDILSSSTVMAHFGYGSGKNSSGGTSTAPYYTLGRRMANSTIGNYSVAEGLDVEASHYRAHAEGDRSVASGNSSHAENYSTASGNYSHAENSASATGNYSHAENEATASGFMSHAEGVNTTASGSASHAEGNGTTASSSYTHASGDGTTAGYYAQFVCGTYNSNSSSDAFEIGGGSSSSRNNIFRVAWNGAVYAGSFNPSSDKRVKKHLGDIAEHDAIEFVRSLRPSKFVKFGNKELGFYAQDVEKTNFGEYLVSTEKNHGYEDFRSLSYNGIIAPLVTYCQHLEKRIARFEEQQTEDD